MNLRQFKTLGCYALLILFMMADIGFCQGTNSSPTATADEASTLLASRLPTFGSLLSNINDFEQFANGGPDGNWFIGFNNAWIIKLPPVPMGNYTRAFIGAKIGRAKTQAKSGRP